MTMVMGKCSYGNLYTLFMILIISTSVIVLSSPHGTLTQTTSISLQQSDLVSREKIDVNSNNDFQEFSGSGTEEDPYIISGFEISSPVSDEYNLINIANTDAFFIVENNYLTGNNQNSGSGISIVSAVNGLVRNNEVRDNTNWGIFIAGSENIIAEYNLVINNMHQGFELLSARNNVIRHNTVNGNGANGISSFFSDNNVIFNNTVISNSQSGIHIEEGFSHDIKGNLLNSNNQNGIWLGGAKSNLIESNEISSNSVGITFRDQTQLGNNPSDDNSVVNNLIFDNFRGIVLTNGNNNIFSNNIIDENDGNGFEFIGGENNSITHNRVSNNEFGYKSTGSVIQNVISCNSFEFNRGFGVFIDNDLEYEIVSRNDFLNNQNEPQASDNGFSSLFENNYWSDIGNQDQDNDGINDKLYEIHGDANNADYESLPSKNLDQNDMNAECNFDLIRGSVNRINQIPLQPELKLPLSNSAFVIFSFLIILTLGIVILYRRKMEF